MGPLATCTVWYSPFGQLRGPRHGGQSAERQHLSITKQHAAGWALGEGGLEAVARETSGLSQSAPATRLGGGVHSVGQCCPLVVEGGADSPAPSLPSCQVEAPGDVFASF